MEKCIFCKIVSKNIPSHIVYEDENFLGLLDIHPASKGHTLLIPKKHARWVHDVEPFGHYWEVAREVKNKLEKAFSPEWVQYFTHGAITHAHIHIIPRYDNVETAKDLLSQSKDSESSEVLASVAEKILAIKD